MYSFHRRVKNIYNLRCTDRQCKGTADYDIESGKVTINKPCTKNYENHSYIKEEIVIKKIRAKSGPRISSNNRFSNKKNNDDISSQCPSVDIIKKKKIKKKKKKESFINNKNMNDISNCKYEDGRKSHQSYTSNINNKSEKKLKKNKPQKNRGNISSNIKK